MRTITGAVALLFLLTPPADAQPVGTWQHRFQDHTVYLRFEPPLLEVWRVDDRGGCMMMPSVVRWEGGAVVHSSGTKWQVEKRSDTLTVALPDTTLEYRRASIVLREQCEPTEEI